MCRLRGNTEKWERERKSFVVWWIFQFIPASMVDENYTLVEHPRDPHPGSIPVNLTNAETKHTKKEKAKEGEWDSGNSICFHVHSIPRVTTHWCHREQQERRTTEQPFCLPFPSLVQPRNICSLLARHTNKKSLEIRVCVFSAEYACWYFFMLSVFVCSLSAHIVHYYFPSNPSSGCKASYW